MKFIEWTNDMSVGSDILDGHHQLIIDCLNQLHPLLDGKGRAEEVYAVLEKLEEFILMHFSEEEQVMKRAGYPDWEAHRELHNKMYDVVFALKTDVEHGRVLDAKHLFDLAYEWLLKHILGEDKKYVPYLSHPEAPQGVWTRSNGREC